MPATCYLKNAWAKKDADGSYWLFIKGGDLQSMFNLYEPSDAEQDEDSAMQRTLNAWLAEQDSTNGKTKKPQDDSPDRI
jgi:hypothetical protein